VEHLEILVEEPSAEEAMNLLVPKICGSLQSFKVHPHQGRHDLLCKLEGRLRGYKAWIPATWGIVVVIDEDRNDCTALKRELDGLARAAGFVPRDSARPTARFQVLNRIAVEELEAWYFGDVAALVAAYPGVPATLGARASFRYPDEIAGGTWEQLERVLQEAGHHLGGLQKIRAAREIALHMEPERNSSPSFCAFRDGLRAMTQCNG
jgi:hypothetical protein